MNDEDGLVSDVIAGMKISSGFRNVCVCAIMFVRIVGVVVIYICL